ncbi:MAG TPA: chloride channel protein [Streptosporangiaceae bacterium]|nr:chloride channel protein [Streptosporangiaceae bacterium]
MPADPLALLRSRSYVVLLVLAAIIGAPISAAAYFFLALVTKLQGWIFSSLPHALGFHAEPMWWPLLPLLLAGVLVPLAIKYLPGTGGHSPADGFKAGGGGPRPAELPGVVLAALATLSLGVVLGPEAPLIALGAGLGICAIKLVKRDAPDRVTAMVAAAGSFAAISTLFGSPLLGAFLLMEASGLSGATLELVLVPGLLAAGVGSLIFIGLDSATGLGTFSLAIPHLPHLGPPTVGEFGWALVIGVAAAIIGTGIHRLGLVLRDRTVRWALLAGPVIGLAIAGLAIAYAAGTGKGSSEVLFSGQNALGPLIDHASGYTVGALLLLIVCKGLAYGGSLSSFRGGPTFPAMVLGAAGGIALSHLPGLPVVAGAAMGIGAMSAVLLRLPLTSVLLATLLLSSDGLQVMPLAIVAVVVAYVVSARLMPVPAEPPAPAPASAPDTAGAGSTPAAGRTST